MVSHGESFYERASFLMSSLMKHWQDFCLSLCCCAGSDRLWQREKIQWLRERFSKKKTKKKKLCDLLNNKLLYPGIVVGIKQLSWCEIWVNHWKWYMPIRQAHCAIVKCNGVIPIPADTVAVLCCYWSNYLFRKLNTLWFVSHLIIFWSFPPFGRLRDCTIKFVFTGLDVTKHLLDIWCTAWVFAATNQVPAGLKINGAQSNPWRTHLIFAVFVCLSDVKQQW